MVDSTTTLGSTGGGRYRVHACSSTEYSTLRHFPKFGSHFSKFGSKVHHLFQIWFQNTSPPQVYHSSDIQQHLSSYAFTFSNADHEFRELMTLTARNPAVLAICLKQGQLVMLFQTRG